MIVFKTFLKILNKYKMQVIMFTVALIFFGVFNIKTNDSNINFVASKPDVLIINNDYNIGVTKNLIEYISKNSNIKEIKNEEDAINDALFYRDVNYIIYIPKYFREDILNNRNPEIEIKKTGNYQSSLADIILKRYLKVANIYSRIAANEEELIKYIDETLYNKSEVEVRSRLNTKDLERVAFYYNFANYCILAGCIYVICLILSSFKEEKIRKRTIISSTNYKKYNRDLLLSNSLFAIILWFIYVILSLVLLGSVMFSMHGVIYIINSFIFTLCAVSISFLLGTLVIDKNAVTGIINVIALGSSFLCGAFVPMQFLPDYVLKIAHVLPSYWYIKTNEVVKEIEIFNIDTIKPLIVNMVVLIIFSLIFVIITSIVSNKNKKID